MLTAVFTRSKWLMSARAVAAGTLAILICGWPHLTVARLALLFGAYALIEGIVVVIGAELQPMLGCKPMLCVDWKLMRLQGLASIAAGVIVFQRPSITPSYLMLQIILRAAAIGGIDGITALRLFGEMQSAGLLLLNGAVPALDEAFVLLRFGVGALGAQWCLAISSIFACVLFTALACRLRERTALVPTTNEHSWPLRL